MIMRRLVHGFISVFFLSQVAASQDIVAKLKPQYTSYLSDTGISNKRMNVLLKALDVKKTKKVTKRKHSKLTYLDNVVSFYLKRPQYKNEVVNSLLQSGYYEYVEVLGGKVNQTLSSTNDPFADPNSGTQYYLDKINAYKAWDISKGDSNVVICIVDNGVEWTHPELKDKIKYNHKDPIDGLDNDNDGYPDNYMGWDMSDFDPYPEDTTGAVGHGTQAAGIAAAMTNNNLGISSVGYNCKFLPIKIFSNNDPNGNASIDGVIYAAEHGCKVINMSWGSVGGFSQYEQAVMNYAAIDNDAVLVAATFPKEGDMVFTTPADYNNVISVVGLQDNGMKGIPQSYHYWTDLSVPSNDIFTTYLNNGYKVSSGISVGVPMVSGAAALARSVYPWMNSTQIQELLRVTTFNIDTIGTNKNYKEKIGKGRLDVYKALTDTTTPSIRILEYDLRKLKGDTVSLQLGFKNYLWDAKSLVLDFSQLNGGFEILDSIAIVGGLKMGDSSNTVLADIKIRIKSYTNSNSTELIRIGITDTANNYFDYQYFYLDKKSVNPPIITKAEIVDVESAEMKIFPNPCSENVYFEIQEAEELSVSDLTGKVLMSIDKPSEIVSLNMKEMQSGIYLAKVRTKTGAYSSKFIKK